MKDITELSVINKFDNDFIKQLRFAFVFNHRKSAIIITNNDCVYVCGDNTVGCLGLGHTNTLEVPTKLDDLCDKQVIKVIDCESLMCAQTSDGKLYFWGKSSKRILGYEENVCFKPTLMQSMADNYVIDIRCCTHYWIALTMNGEVYEWSNSNSDHLFDPQLVYALKFHTIIAISSGYDLSLALTDNGEVFAWGDNEYGQCGCDTSDDYFEEPIKVEGLADNNVIKISCGRNHSIVLTESGDIYTFGANDCAQLGDNSTDDKFIATKITNSVKFVDIATQGYESDMSIGLSTDGFCYVWGKVGDREIIKPTKTEYNSIKDVIHHYKYPFMTFNSLYFKEMFDKFSPYDRIVQSFNNQELSDLSFKIDGKFIYAQKSFLKTVCKHFSVMFAPNVWLESNSKAIEITQYSYSVYYSFLKYLYTDSVDIQSKHLIELYHLADSYLEINLKEICVKLIFNKTNITNVYTFYSFAIQNNLEKLDKYLYDYLIKYMSDVVRTEAYAQSNDNSVLKKFVNTSIINGRLLIGNLVKH